MLRHTSFQTSHPTTPAKANVNRQSTPAMATRPPQRRGPGFHLRQQGQRVRATCSSTARRTDDPLPAAITDREQAENSDTFIACGSNGYVQLARLHGQRIAVKRSYWDNGNRMALDACGIWKEALVLEAIARLDPGTPGLQHLPVYLGSGAIEETGEPYLMLQEIHGTTLADDVFAHPLGMDRACHIVAGVMSALAVLAPLGVVHQDIKRDNVMLLAATDQAVLIDFGHASGHQGIAAQRPLEQIEGFDAGGAASTHAPEYASGDPRCIGVASDVWSAALLLLDLAYGPGDERVAALCAAAACPHAGLYEQQLAALLAPFRALHHGGTLVEALQRLLAFHADQRLDPATAADILNAFVTASSDPAKRAPDVHILNGHVLRRVDPETECSWTISVDHLIPRDRELDNALLEQLRGALISQLRATPVGLRQDLLQIELGRLPVPIGRLLLDGLEQHGTTPIEGVAFDRMRSALGFQSSTAAARLAEPWNGLKALDSADPWDVEKVLYETLTTYQGLFKADDLANLLDDAAMEFVARSNRDLQNFAQDVRKVRTMLEQTVAARYPGNSLMHRSAPGTWGQTRDAVRTAMKKAFPDAPPGFRGPALLWVKANALEQAIYGKLGNEAASDRAKRIRAAFDALLAEGSILGPRFETQLRLALHPELEAALARCEPWPGALPVVPAPQTFDLRTPTGQPRAPGTSSNQTAAPRAVSLQQGPSNVTSSRATLPPRTLQTHMANQPMTKRQTDHVPLSQPSNKRRAVTGGVRKPD